MSLLLVTVFSILGIILGKLLFYKWVNHLTLYCIIMGGLIFLYELKLFPYPDITPIAWFFIISSFISFLLGILTVISARNLFPKKQLFDNKFEISLKVFRDNGKALKYSIFFLSIIALFVAVQRWVVLIGMFGSIPAVLLNAGLVYRMNVQGEIKDFIPILPSFVYVAIFLSGIYTAYKGRFSLLAFFPFIGVILKQLTNFGRAELLLICMEFVFSFFLFRHLIYNSSNQRFIFSKKNAIIATILSLILIIASTSFIKMSRGVRETYVGESRQLKQLSENMIFSPSIYLYLSSDVGVLSKYLETEGDDTKFGENTFFITHVFLSKLGVVKKPADYQKGYFIPMWVNTGTYIRELHADFGIAGIFLVPYLIGLIITWLWFKFYEKKNLIVFAFLVYFYLIIGFSFLVMVTRLNQWYISLLMVIIYIPFLEKMAMRNKNLNPRKE